MADPISRLLHLYGTAKGGRLSFSAASRAATSLDPRLVPPEEDRPDGEQIRMEREVDPAQELPIVTQDEVAGVGRDWAIITISGHGLLVTGCWLLVTSYQSPVTTFWLYDAGGGGLVAW